MAQATKEIVGNRPWLDYINKRGDIYIGFPDELMQCARDEHDMELKFVWVLVDDKDHYEKVVQGFCLNCQARCYMQWRDGKTQKIIPLLSSQHFRHTQRRAFP